MNVYVIYRFVDVEYVKQQIELIKKQTTSITFYYFDPNKKPIFWHKKAREKIRESNLVVFFDNFNADSQNNTKNIKWELNCAEKFKKKIIVIKDNIDLIDSYSSKIYNTDYSDTLPNKFKYKTVSKEEMADFLIKQSTWNIDQHLIKNKDMTNEEKQLLLRQYEIMIDTSEKLMERRQSTGNLYTTICSALIAFVGTSFSFGNLLIPSIICFLSGIIIIILSINWRSSLKAYELNNAGKFEVINEIERYLPAEMFDCEYRYNTFNGIRSYSTRERTLPLLFILFGVVIIIVSILMYVLL